MTKPKKSPDLKIISLFIIGISILCLSLFLNYKNPRQFPWQQNPLETNGFHNSKEKDPFAAPKAGEYQTIKSFPLNFAVKVQDLNKPLQLSFKYRCQNCTQIWLSTSPIKLLLYHQLLDSYYTHPLTNNSVWLYQHRPAYKSITDFFKSPPQEIFTEKSLLQYYPMPNTHKTFLEDIHALPANPPAYILSTFEKPRIFDDWSEFSRTINLHGLNINNLSIAFTLEATGPADLKLDLTPPLAAQ